MSELPRKGDIVEFDCWPNVFLRYEGKDDKIRGTEMRCDSDEHFFICSYPNPLASEPPISDRVVRASLESGFKIIRKGTER